MRVGVIGGGQLARMMVSPAVALGIEIRVLAESADSSARLAATVIGDYREAETVLGFAADVDVVTFDHEHVPQEVLARLEASGVTVRPGRDALEAAQDKIRMRERLAALGVPMPGWAVIRTEADLESFLAEHGGVAVVKTPRGGYDGKGVRVVRASADAADWLAEGELLAEELVDFRRELAQQVARRPSGEMAAWPLVETIQRDGVCAEVLAPAPDAGDLAVEARGIAETIAAGLEVTGVLAVELFQAADGRLLVNELAMRPHNSGHWSIDGAVTSQFEQHLRAVLDLPLGDPSPTAPWAVMVNVLGGPEAATMPDRYPAAFAAERGVKFHSYGKASRPGRKVGHVTATGTDLADVRARARAAAGFFEA
ncbi:5-(carboxyamino)imidazole ribonucleotide synthase [Pseudolysinimonas sp.]|uniref:5-(carboxyamino)imidazole ribonucleotide synthase n=1 Tax=Pseudolysinimonas sp. TaxID=2680009 RepID=UPI00286AE0D8|nr:5-(carboxyamino)imidazole ribonucleotide synthase [Pseudolysinimonas sp.]